MATKTLGTVADDSLTALAFEANDAIADIATINNGIKDDQNIAHPVVGGAFGTNGLLTIPNRGVLKVLPGDVVAIDDRGWPILLSADTIANGADWDLD